MTENSNETTVEQFTFTSEGERLAGNLFMPKDGKVAGMVITTGPLASVKGQAAGVYAQAMAALLQMQKIDIEALRKAFEGG